jgi:ATP-dependent 26S proteasome regulatory subunit
MSTFADQIRNAVNGCNPLIYLETPEENRVEAVIREIGPDCIENAEVYSWTCTTGIVPASDDVDTKDPVAAIQHIIAHKKPGFYIMKDVTEFMDQPMVVRALRDAYHALAEAGTTCIVLVSPEAVIPRTIEKEVTVVDIGLPTPQELIGQFLSVQETYPDRQIPTELHGDIGLGLKGLTLNEVTHLAHRILRANKLDETSIFDQVFNEKKMLVKKAGFLEFVPPKLQLDQMGGLENLKDWITKRRAVFTQEAVDQGLPIPKGILIMGVAGCGKSLCAKVVSAYWKLPLFRLDMNLVNSCVYGTPEAAFDRALRTIESVAPAVLWIDEIENGLGMAKAGNAGNHVFSAFLTWMQEKPPLVFVAATANQIQYLPAEVIRKGRFDEVFFCDLPDEDERRAIIRIHIGNQGGDPDSDRFDLDNLTMTTEGWNGAEVEQAVISARIDASQENREFNSKDIYRHTRSIVPLSETMHEQIKTIRDWAWGRATQATKKKKPKL